MGRRSDNEGAIFQRKSTGKWIAQVFIGYAPDGKRAYKTYTCATQREALEKLKAARGTLDRTGALATKRQTVKQFLTHWLEDVIRPRRAPRTYESCAAEIRRNISPSGLIALQSRATCARIKVQMANGAITGASVALAAADRPRGGSRKHVSGWNERSA